MYNYLKFYKILKSTPFVALMAYTLGQVTPLWSCKYVILGIVSFGVYKKRVEMKAVEQERQAIRELYEELYSNDD